MAELKKCPSCGSERVVIDGVLQRKKNVWYYLSGGNIQDAGARAGFKTAAKLKGLTENAECMDCRHKWTVK